MQVYSLLSEPPGQPSYVPSYLDCVGGLVVKDPPGNAGDAGLIPGSGTSPGGGNGNPLQYSCMDNPMDRGFWWAKVHWVAKNQTWLASMHTPVSLYLFCPPPTNLLSTLFLESYFLNINLTITLFRTCLWLHITLKTEVPKFHKSQWLCIAVISLSALWLKRNTYLFDLLSNEVCVCVCVCAQSCPALHDPLDCNPPGSSVHGIFQARILEWVAIFCPRGSSRPTDQTHVFFISCIVRWILYHRRQREMKMDGSSLEGPESQVEGNH